MAISGMIVGKTFVTLMVDDRTETITNAHPNYDAIREAIKTKDLELAEKLIAVDKQIADWTRGKVSVNNGRVLYDNEVVHGALVDRILDMISEGFDAEPMLAFLDNLMQNPSKRAVDELYGFLECTSLPITEDGHFLAYKKVRSDYLDFYTGTYDNSVGKTVGMVRNQVDEDKNRTCSAGLHFCSLSYLKHYHGSDGRVMIVKINPRDVVAIPADYNNAKGRACKYEVVGEHTSELEEAFNKPVYSDKYYEMQEDNFDIDDEELQMAFDLGSEQGYSDAEDGEEYDSTPPCDLHAIYASNYRKGYSAGWDEYKNEEISYRDYQPAAVVPKPVPVLKASHAPVATPVSGGLVGYNQGRKDASTGVAYNNNPAAHAVVVTDLAAYKKGYAKGWDSIKK